MAVEARRGCGYRKVGGLYVVGDYSGEPCERLPVPIIPCTVCGECLKFSRSWAWVKPKYILEGARTCTHHEPHCGRCPVCSPELIGQTCQPHDKVGLLWVGKQFYKSPAEWVDEAVKLGISRRIAAIPKGFVLGKTLLFFAHQEAIQRDKDPAVPGVFFVWRPQRIELIVTKSMRNEEWVQDYEKRGVTLVEVPDDDPDHLPEKRAKGTRRKRAADSVAVSKPIYDPDEHQLRLFNASPRP